jgi:hypothetical protein
MVSPVAGMQAADMKGYLERKTFDSSGFFTKGT